MKIIKYLVIAIILLVVVVIGGGVFFLSTLDVNNYKEEIASEVKKATGRDLVITGGIKTSWWPLGLSLGETTFGNAPGFGDTPMATVEEVSISVAVLPLLKSKVEASKLILHGLKVNLHKNAQGVTNWDDLVSEESSSEETSDGSSAAPELVINGIDISDAEFHWQDDQVGTKIQIAPFNLTTGELGDGKATDVKMDLKLKNAEPVMDASLKIVTKALFDSKAQTLSLKDLDVELHSTGESFPNGAMDLDLNSDVSGNFATQKYAMQNTQIKISGTGDAFPEGKLEVALQTNIDADVANEALSLSSLVVSMLDTQLTGNASVKSFSKPDVKFTLASELLDLDKLLPTSSADEKAESTSADENEPIELPTKTLRDMRVNGDIAVGKLIISGMTMTNVKATVTAKGGLLQVTPMSMNLYDGSMKGKASVDVRGDKPKYALATDIANVAIDKLSIDFLGEEQAYIRGASNLALNIHTTGNSIAELKQALGGKVNLKANNGALRDEKLASNVEKAAALLRKRDAKPSGEELVFDELFGSYNIANGVATNKDLTFKSPVVNAKGEGTIDIGKSKTDYKIAIGLSDEPDKCGVPVKIKGPFEDPKYGLDTEGLLKCTSSEKIAEKKEELKEEFEEKKEEKVEELKEKFGGKLKDKLKLF
ncbi:MAG: AsmA family protein [Gammaproteobacteria bacterium]|nr:MAG: AsmA family protein [Gammaproteobacteria bacterium]